MDVLGGITSRRRIAVVVGVLVVLGVVGSVVGVLLTRTGDRRFAWAGGGDAPPVVVSLPGRAGKPQFSALPAPKDGISPGFKAVGSPLRIEAKPFGGGTGTLTLGYDPAKVKSPSQLTVLTYAPEYGLWVPVGGEVNTVAHRITVRTSHLSDWVVAETDPDAYEAAFRQTEALTKGLSGSLLRTMYGPSRSAACDPKRLLLPAKLRFEVNVSQSPTQVCEEVSDDGSYRLSVANQTDTPLLVHAPDGFRIDGEPELLPTFDDVINAVARPQKGDQILPPHGRIAFLFTGDALPTPAVEIRGDVSWPATITQLAFHILTAMLGEDGKDPTQLRAALAALSSGADLGDCLTKAANTMVGQIHKHGFAPTGLVKAAGSALWDCKSTIADAAESVLTAIAGKKADQSNLGQVKAVVGNLFDRAKMVLQIGEYMSIAREELDALFNLLGTAGGVDLGMHIRPVRVMSVDETRALPSGCAPPDPDKFLPAGAPATSDQLCTVATDLDANGHDDRMIIWRRPTTYNENTKDRYRFGAVAYLDDNTFHLLEEPVFRAGSETVPYGDEDPTPLVGPGGRNYVKVQVQEGSSTNWYLLFGVPQDRRLHVLTEPSGKPFQLPIGGAVAYSSDYGCVTEGGQELLASAGREDAPDTLDHLQLDLYRIDGGRITPTGERLGAVRDTSTAAGRAETHRPWLPGLGGYQCGGKAGDIGPFVAPATTPEAALTDLVSAAAGKQLKTAWRRLAADTFPENKQPDQADRDDVWKQLSSTYDARSLKGVAPVCTRIQLGTLKVSGARCTLKSAKAPELTAELLERKGAGGWGVVSIGPPIQEPAGPAPSGDESFQAVVTGISGNLVTFNKVQYFDYKHAAKACQEDHVVPRDELCTDYYVRDKNPAQYRNPIDAATRPQVYNYSTMKQHAVPAAQWLATVRRSGTTYWQMTVANGKLTTIQAIYTP
ncbi:hypothetical protein AB0E69_11120 [Kribbella sp. NPDC026611]|uniref:hypothetical protein n=1 Tax=Kribbella sp. NPDC026611 TaxID=3154911 RepID=UPI0033C1255F